MAVTWFPVDSNSPNDFKMKAILRQGGQPWVGAVYLLWCYVASHGKGGEPGLGVRADGTPLDPDELTSECGFTNQADAMAFLDFAAQVKHIHPELWRQKGIVFLPAMWTRLINYARSKGRQGSQYPDAQALTSAVLSGAVKSPVVPVSPRRVTSVPAGTARAKKPLHNKQNITNRQKKENTGAAAEHAAPLTTDAKPHPVKEVLTFHDQLFQRATGKPYPDYTAGDAKNVQLMLRKTSQADLQAEIAWMFECPDPFVQQCGYTIGAFLKLRPKLTVLKTKGISGGRDPTAETKGRVRAEPGKYAGL